MVGGVFYVAMVRMINDAQGPHHAANSNALSYQQKLDLFKQDCGRFPTTNEGLTALVRKPAGLDCKKYQDKGYVGELHEMEGCAFLYESNGMFYSLACYIQDSGHLIKGTNTQKSKITDK